MRNRLVSAILAALLAGAPHVVLAQSGAKGGTQINNPFLKAGIELFNDLEYPAALEQLKKAESQSNNSVGENVLTHMYEGIVDYELGKSDDAETQFKIALALYPEATLPKGISPKTSALFEKVRAEIKKESGASVSVPDVPKAEQPKPPTATTPPMVMTQKPEEETSSGPSVVPWIAAGAGVVALGAGTFFGLRAHSLSQSASTDAFQDVANNDLSNAKIDADIAYAAWGAAVVAAGVFAFTYFTQSDEPSAKPSTSAGAGGDASGDRVRSW